MRGNAQGPTNETAVPRSRSAGEHNEKGAIERCDADPATGRDGEPAHGLTKKSEASSQAIAPQRDEHQNSISRLSRDITTTRRCCGEKASSRHSCSASWRCFTLHYFPSCRLLRCLSTSIRSRRRILSDRTLRRADLHPDSVRRQGCSTSTFNHDR